MPTTRSSRQQEKKTLTSEPRQQEKKTTRKSRLADKSANVDAASVNLIDCLPLLLSIQDGKLLTATDKHKLRLTCKAARTIVDPTLHTIRLIGNETYFDRADTEAFFRSPLVIHAAALRVQYTIVTYDYIEDVLSCIPFSGLKAAYFTMDDTAVGALCALKWPMLKELCFTVRWNYKRISSAEFNGIWNRFSRANWPLLETLVIVTTMHAEEEELEEDEYNSDASEESDDGDPKNLEFRELVLMLKYFPNLKHLNLDDCISLANTKTIAAIPHSKLERLELSFRGGNAGQKFKDPDAGAIFTALTKSKWPKLREVVLYGLKGLSVADIRAFSKLPWLPNLKLLTFLAVSLPFDAAKELFRTLQSCQLLETLELNKVAYDALPAFQDVDFKNLKKLCLTLKGEDDGDRNGEINIALSSLFCPGKLPRLELLVLKCDSEYYRMSLYHWVAAPDVTGVGSVSILPSLKSLRITGLHINRECSQFLGSLCTRGGCEFDLFRCEVDSYLNRDSSPLPATLAGFNISSYKFQEELRRLKFSLYGAGFEVTALGGHEEEVERELEKEKEDEEEVEKEIPRLEPGEETDWVYKDVGTVSELVDLGVELMSLPEVAALLRPASLGQVPWSEKVYCTHNFVHSMAANRIMTSEIGFNEYLRPVDLVLLLPGDNSVVLLAEREANRVLKVELENKRKGRESVGGSELLHLCYACDAASQNTKQPKLAVSGSAANRGISSLKSELYLEQLVSAQLFNGETTFVDPKGRQWLELEQLPWLKELQWLVYHKEDVAEALVGSRGTRVLLDRSQLEMACGEIK